MSDTNDQGVSLNRVTEIVSAFVSNNSVSNKQISDLITSVHQTLMKVTGQAPEKPTPAVSVRRSVQKDHIVCLVCGQKQKMLKRHLKTAHHLSPDAYKELFDLKPDYPLVAPSYAEVRSKLAKKIGLGRKRGQRRSKRK